MKTHAEYARLTRGVQLLANLLEGEGPQSPRMVFEMSPQAHRELLALQGHITTNPGGNLTGSDQHPRGTVLAFLNGLVGELADLAGDAAMATLRKIGGALPEETPAYGDPLLPSLQVRVAEWLERAGKLVRDETETAELLITLHTPQSCDDDDTKMLCARLEEKFIAADLQGALPGIKHR